MVLSTITSEKYQLLATALYEKAKDLAPLYRRFSTASGPDVSDFLEERNQVHAWWLGAPDPNRFNNFTHYNIAMDQWMQEYGNFLE